MSSRRGIEHPDTIDLVVHNSEHDTYSLVIDHPRPWCGSEDEAARLQEKINGYASFAVDGQMFRLYPDARGKPIAVVVCCPAEPIGAGRALLDHARAWLAQRGVSLEIMVVDSL